MDFAYVFARGNSGAGSSVTLMKERIDSVRIKFDNAVPGCGCQSLTGIVSHSAAQTFSVYPNPAGEFITVVLPKSNNTYRIRITDLSGRLIKEVNTSNSEEKITFVNELAPGIYIIDLQSNTFKSTQRFIRR